MTVLKNIVLLNDYDYVNGGISQIAITSANVLSERGYRVIFISAVKSPGSSTLSDKVERYSTGQYDILNNPSRIDALKTGLWNPTAVRLLQSVIADLDPAQTVIHLHSWIKALSPAIGKVLTSGRFPVVCTLHDFFTACPNGGFYNYQRNEICRLKAMSLSCICTNCDARSYPQKIWRVVRQTIQSQFGHIPQGIKHFISVTKFSEDILRPYLPPSASIYPLSNPVVHQGHSPQQADLSSGRLLYIGRLSPEKGVSLACDAARAIGRPFTIIGDGPLKKDLQEKYPEFDFKGWLSQEQVFQEMLQSSALLFPSIWYETQGLVVLEALSAGLPVIVSDRCAASEYADGRNGLTFKAGDVDDLIKKIQLLLEDPARREEMGRYAFDTYWKDPLLVDNFIRGTIDIYDKVLSMTHNL